MAIQKTRKESTCTICGLPPHKLPLGPGRLENAPLLDALEREIRGLVRKGYSVFQTGMDRGIDIWAALIVLALREQRPRLQLHAFLPCETQAVRWSEYWRRLYYNKILPECDEVDEVIGHYYPGCLEERTRKMLDRSSLLLSVHGGEARGNVAYALRYARERGLRLRNLDPRTIGGSRKRMEP